MKQFLILLNVLLIPVFSIAQESYTYRTLEDLLDNKPTDEIPSTFRYKRQRHQGRLKGKKISAYRFKGSRDYKLPKGKTFAVFMDGQLFINPDRPRLRRSTDFFKVEWIGDYGYFVNIQEYPVWVNEVLMEETVLKEKLLDRSTGKIIDLNKKNLRAILQDRPELLKDFELERKKKRKLKEYLILSENES